MSKLAASLVLAAQAIPHSYAPGEVKEERDLRVELIAMSAWEAAAPFADGKGWSRFELALATIVLQGNESGGFDLRVHAGEKHPIWTQDHGLSKCLGQHQVSKLVPTEEWARLAGTDEDATLRCARATAMVLVSHAKQCGVYYSQRATEYAVAEAFASYGTGGHCRPSDSNWKRAKQWNALLKRYGQKPDVPGFRRATPAEVPPEIKSHANDLVADIERKQLKPGNKVLVSDRKGRDWTLVVERHTQGKIGISSFVKEEATPK